MSNYFAELLAVNVSEHIEKKNGFSYVSWPFAVAELRKRHPDATWNVTRHDGKPYIETPAGCFVEVAVTVGGVTLSQIHPVLNHANRPIKEPTAFDINTSIQRALVKAIALHGLGLYVYAGEDLPPGEKESKQEEDPRRAEVVGDLEAAAARGMDAFKMLWESLTADEKNLVGRKTFDDLRGKAKAAA